MATRDNSDDWDAIEGAVRAALVEAGLADLVRELAKSAQQSDDDEGLDLAARNFRLERRGRGVAHTSPDPPADVYRRQAAGDVNPWWGDDSQERYWLEITDRPDIGADLHAPQRDATRSNEMDDAAPKWVLDTRDPIASAAGSASATTVKRIAGHPAQGNRRAVHV